MDERTKSPELGTTVGPEVEGQPVGAGDEREEIATERASIGNAKMYLCWELGSEPQTKVASWMERRREEQMDSPTATSSSGSSTRPSRTHSS